ncbi:MAG: hypothetical protein HAW63_03640 [Bdellovibrionaceae bacterium]|nr:hypothetical protein [Pseudobdellovibrionaceae bacterium]
MSTTNKPAFYFSRNLLSFFELHFKKIILVIVLLTSVFLIQEWRDNNTKKEAKKVSQIFYVIQKKIKNKENQLIEKNTVKNAKFKKTKKKYVFKKTKKILKNNFSSLVTEYKSLLQQNHKTTIFFGSSLNLAKFLSDYKDFASSAEVLLQASKKVKENSLFYPLIFQALGLSYLKLGQYSKAAKAFVTITSKKKAFLFIQPSSLLNLSLSYFQLKKWKLLKESISTLEANYPQSSEASTAQAIKRYLILKNK